jgi:type II secretory pathway pseudopilin PulG
VSAQEKVTGMADEPEAGGELRNREAGVSLIEIVVALFIFALMSMAVLPLFIGAVQASAGNRDLIAANSLASARLAILQASFPNSALNSCATVAASAASNIADPAGSGATASIAFGTCPSSYPAVVTVTVQAFRPNSAKAVVILNSAILVSSA